MSLRRQALLALVAAVTVGCAAANSPGKVAEMRALEAESAARLTAEGEALYYADAVRITPGSYKGGDGATRLLEEGELRRGIREASKALFLGQTAGPALLAFANRDLAYAYSLAGSLDRAAQFASAAIAEARATRDEWFRPANRLQVLGPAYKVLGDVKLRRGQVKAAIGDYEQALAQSEPAFQPFVRVSLANAYLADGSPVKARALFAEAEAGASPTLRVLIQRGLGRVAMAEGRYQEAAKLFADAVAKASGDDAAYQRLWALDGLAQAQRAGKNTAGAIEAYRQAMSAAENVRARFRSEEFKSGFFGDTQQVFDDAVQALVEDGQVEAALDASERSRSRALLDLVRGRVAASAGTQVFVDTLGRPIEISRLRAALPENLVLVEYHVLADRTYAWSVRRSGISLVTLDIGGASLAREVTRYREEIRSRSADTSRMATDLHARLLAPLTLGPGEPVVFMPHGSLHYVPFHALRTGKGYVIEERAVSYAPSASAAVHLFSRQTGARRQLLGLGNPDLGSPTLALPGAQREVERLATLFPGAEVYVQKAATKERLLARAPQSDLVHVAAHAEIDEIDPLYSLIRLAAAEKVRGDLEAHEIYRMDLRRASVVVLSACDTGLGRVSRGDELWGFTRSFLSAGAPTLLVSLWPVEDESTARLMGQFYEALRTGSTQRALRAAQLDVLRDPRTAHPFFWAPFVLVGDWR